MDATAPARALSKLWHLRTINEGPGTTSHSYRFTDDVIARRDGHDASRSTVLSFGRRVNGGRLKATDRIRANSMRLGITLSC